MKLVTFARAMAPHGPGDTRVVPDDVAQRLSDEGMLSSAEPWPANEASEPRSPQKPRRPIGTPDSRLAR